MAGEIAKRARAAVTVLALVGASSIAGCGGSTVRVGPTPPSLTPTTALSAAARARRIVDVQRRLGVDMHYSLPMLVSNLASGQVSESCSRVDDDKFHRDEIAISWEQRRESVDHWTRVEAGYVAGACPARLHSFMLSLARLGYQGVTTRVSKDLAQLGIAS